MRTADSKHSPLIEIHEGQGHGSPKRLDYYKIVYHDVRMLTATDIVRQIQVAFDVQSHEVEDLRVCRVDFCVDVAVPVQWFREHARVRFKQSTRQFSGWNVQGQRAFTTLMFGTHDDLYRIYDKVAEMTARKRDILHPGLGNGDTLPLRTRIERQCVGRCVPRAVNKLGLLLRNAATFNPFSNLVFRPSTADRYRPETARDWLMVEGLAAVLKRDGYDAVRRQLNVLGNNAARLLNKYSPMLPTELRLTADQLNTMYRRNVERRLYPFGKDTGAMVWTL